MCHCATVEVLSLSSVTGHQRLRFLIIIRELIFHNSPNNLGLYFNNRYSLKVSKSNWINRVAIPSIMKIDCRYKLILSYPLTWIALFWYQKLSKQRALMVENSQTKLDSRLNSISQNIKLWEWKSNSCKRWDLISSKFCFKRIPSLTTKFWIINSLTSCNTHLCKMRTQTPFL